MSKGKWFLTTLKREVRLAAEIAAAVRMGTAQAEQKLHEKKSLLDSLREHVGRAVDRVDWLELAAIGGLTYLIHGVLVSTEAFVLKVQEKPLLILGWINVSVPLILLGALGKPSPELQKKMDELAAGIEGKLDLPIWILSFVIAFLVIRYGMQSIMAQGGFLAVGQQLLGLAAA